MNEEQSPPRSAAGEREAVPVSDAAGEMVCLLCSAEYPSKMRFCPADGSVLRPATGSGEGLIGRIIDERYYLFEKLGEGGMGDVYLAEHVRTHR
jgi:eukaryotic-like serine/threonine-protein kinase